MINKLRSVIINKKYMKWLTIGSVIFMLLVCLRFVQIVPLLHKSYVWFAIESLYCIVFFFSTTLYALYSTSTFINILAPMCIILATLDSVLFDSGFFYIYICLLFSLLLWQTSDIDTRLAFLFITNACTLELLSFFCKTLSGGINNLVFLHLLKRPVVDLWLFFSFFLYLHAKRGKRGISKTKRYVMVVGISFLCIVSLLFSIKERANQIYVTLNNKVLGESLYFVSSADTNKVLTCSSTGDLSLDTINYSRNQTFHVDYAEESSYYHIISKNNQVLDVLSVLFTEGNKVICHVENGVIGQHWFFVKQDNGGYILQAHDSSYYIGYDSLASSICLTTDISQATNFTLVKAVPVPFLSILTYTKRSLIIAGYVVILTLIIFLEFRVIFKHLNIHTKGQ